MREIKFALLGFGGIAQSHKNAHLRLEAEGKERLVAVCDITPSSFEKRIKINKEIASSAISFSYSSIPNNSLAYGNSLI